jgi:hypothetical protein
VEQHPRASSGKPPGRCATSPRAPPSWRRTPISGGARYVRDGLDRYPEAGRYISEGAQAVSRPVEQYPLTAILLAGAVGYLLAYLIHGGGSRWGREDVPDYARTRDYDRRSR